MLSKLVCALISNTHLRGSPLRGCRGRPWGAPPAGTETTRDRFSLGPLQSWQRAMTCVSKNLKNSNFLICCRQSPHTPLEDTSVGSNTLGKIWQYLSKAVKKWACWLSNYTSKNYYGKIITRIQKLLKKDVHHSIPRASKSEELCDCNSKRLTRKLRCKVPQNQVQIIELTPGHLYTRARCRCQS